MCHVYYTDTWCVVYCSLALGAMMALPDFIPIFFEIDALWNGVALLVKPLEAVAAASHLAFIWQPAITD